MKEFHSDKPRRRDESWWQNRRREGQERLRAAGIKEKPLDWARITAAVAEAEQKGTPVDWDAVFGVEPVPGTSLRVDIRVKIVGGNGGTVPVGGQVRLIIVAHCDGYLTLLNRDGALVELFPNCVQTENFMRAGQPFVFPPPDAPPLTLREPGRERFQAVLTQEKVDLLSGLATHLAEDRYRVYLTVERAERCEDPLAARLAALASDAWTEAWAEVEVK